MSEILEWWFNHVFRQQFSKSMKVAWGYPVTPQENGHVTMGTSSFDGDTALRLIQDQVDVFDYQKMKHWKDEIGFTGAFIVPSVGTQELDWAVNPNLTKVSAIKADVTELPDYDDIRRQLEHLGREMAKALSEVADDFLKGLHRDASTILKACAGEGDNPLLEIPGDGFVVKVYEQSTDGSTILSGDKASDLETLLSMVNGKLRCFDLLVEVVEITAEGDEGEMLATLRNWSVLEHRDAPHGGTDLLDFIGDYAGEQLEEDVAQAVYNTVSEYLNPQQPTVAA